MRNLFVTLLLALTSCRNGPTLSDAAAPACCDIRAVSQEPAQTIEARAERRSPSTGAIVEPVGSCTTGAEAPGAPHEHCAPACC